MPIDNVQDFVHPQYQFTCVFGISASRALASISDTAGVLTGCWGPKVSFTRFEGFTMLRTVSFQEPLSTVARLSRREFCFAGLKANRARGLTLSLCDSHARGTPLLSLGILLASHHSLGITNSGSLPNFQQLDHTARCASQIRALTCELAHLWITRKSQKVGVRVSET